MRGRYGVPLMILVIICGGTRSLCRQGRGSTEGARKEEEGISGGPVSFIHCRCNGTHGCVGILV
jgi:hypothetical protein